MEFTITVFLCLQKMREKRFVIRITISYSRRDDKSVYEIFYILSAFVFAKHMISTVIRYE